MLVGMLGMLSGNVSVKLNTTVYANVLNNKYLQKASPSIFPC